MPALAQLLIALLGNSLARVLTGAGLGLATAGALLPLVKTGLNLIAQHWSGVPSDIANVMLMSGFGESVTILGSAIVTRVGIDAAKVAVTKAAKK